MKKITAGFALMHLYKYARVRETDISWKMPAFDGRAVLEAEIKLARRLLIFTVHDSNTAEKFEEWRKHF